MKISAGPGLYSCSCNCGWTGTNCNSQINQCVNTPCLNGGLCQNVAPCGFQCICPVGYSGSKCDIVINYCASNPCSSNGLCLNSNFGYTCSCSPGWTGTLCQIQINVNKIFKIFFVLKLICFFLNKELRISTMFQQWNMHSFFNRFYMSMCKLILWNSVSK